MDGPTDKKDGDSRQPHKPFDPRPYLRRIRVRDQESDYLDVKWRLLWLRTEHPEARITTEHVTLNESIAVFRATVEIPSGGCATGYGSETREDFEEYIETAETKAIGRALAALGYGTQFVSDFDLEDQDEQREQGQGKRAPLADAPVERPALETARVRVVPPPVEPEKETPASEPEPESEIDSEPMLDEFEPAERPLPEPRPIRARQEQADREPFEQADYSWNEFWKWARALGYQSRSQVAELLGQDLGEMTPHEIRRQLIEYRQQQGIDE